MDQVKSVEESLSKIGNDMDTLILCPISHEAARLDNWRTSRTYVRPPTFIDVRMILDMHMLTRTLIFSLDFFLVLLILYCLRTYCYIFDLYLCFARGRFFTVYICFKETLFFNFLYKLFN